MRSDLIYIPDSELDALIQQDTPYLDLTTLGLDIGDEPGSVVFLHPRALRALLHRGGFPHSFQAGTFHRLFPPHRHTDRSRRVVLHRRGQRL